MSERIFLLNKHDGDNQTWLEIPKNLLKNYLTDGSIEEGDLLVYSNKVKKAYAKVEVKLEEDEKK